LDFGGRDRTREGELERQEGEKMEQVNEERDGRRKGGKGWRSEERE